MGHWRRSSSGGRIIVQDDQSGWPRAAVLLLIQVNVTQVFERVVGEPLKLPTMTGSTADIVEGKDAPKHLDNQFRWNIGTDNLEGSICSKVPLTWRTSCVKGGRVRECLLLLLGQKDSRWVEYNLLTFIQAAATSKKRCSPCLTVREATVWSFLAI